jgi:hypothetical protein
MSGHWPPEWDDSYAGLPDEWNADDAHDAEYPDQEMSEVASFLASLPSPVLPSGFEARISAAIAAEAAARSEGTGWPDGAGSVDTRADGAEWTETGSVGAGSAGAGSAAVGSADTTIAGVGPPVAGAGAGDAEITDRSSRLSGFTGGSPGNSPPASAKRGHRRTSTSASRSRPRGSRPGGRRLRMPSAAMTGPLLICLVIAGFAILFAHLGSSSSSSSSSSLAEPAAQGTASAASGGHAAVAAPYTRNNFYAGQGGQFAVIESGTSYQGSTLVSQVRAQLYGLRPTAQAPPALSPAASVEASASASSGTNAAPPPTLSGCVSRLTGGVAPSLVDRARYDGSPAFIIAVPTRVWVVRLGCTAANQQVITSVSLTGLYGNLSALGSVER